MELYQLRQFQAAARHKNMTRAASELCIAQPALSKTIHKLEEEFGAQLFIRNKKGLNVPVREKFCLNMQTEYWLFLKMLRVLSVKVLAMQAK